MKKILASILIISLLTGCSNFLSKKEVDPVDGKSPVIEDNFGPSPRTNNAN